MKITKEDLRRIIVEEYIAEGALDEDNVDDLLSWIKGGEKPEWAGDKASSPGLPPKVPPTDSDETYPMDIPSDDAPESEYSGFQDDSGPGLESQLAALIQGMPPEEVADLFQAVFKTIPGVEMGAAEEEPESPYSQEIEKLMSPYSQEIEKMIHEVMMETEWHDIFAGETAAPHSTQAEPSSKEKLEQVYQLLGDTVDGYSPDTHEYSVLKSALDGITNILDGLDTGDNMGRADENLIDV